MRVLSWLFALFAVVTHSVSAQEAALPTGAVAGSVFCSDSQTPCSFAALTMETAPPKDDNGPSPAVQAHSYSASADINGSFRIDLVLPGDYYILPRLAGYLTPYDIAANDFRDQGQKKKPPRDVMDASLTRITVAAAQTTSVSLSLARGASLGGTVLYDDGAPGVNLPVHLYRKDPDGMWRAYWNLSGDSPLAPLGLGPHTDDRGRYYEPGLPPGKYKVEVTLPVATFAAMAITGSSGLNAAITKGDALQVFNGGRFRLADAPAIELQPGEDRSDIDLTIRTDGLRTVGGVVTSKVNQHGIAKGTVQLLDPQDKSVLREADLKEDGSFVFQYVVDGSYLVQVQPNSPYPSVTAPLLVAGDVTDLNYSLANAGR
jgi:hypothetical protein